MEQPSQTPWDSLINLDSFKLDLGAVAIEELTLSSGKLMCCGRINVIPLFTDRPISEKCRCCPMMPAAAE